VDILAAPQPSKFFVNKKPTICNRQENSDIASLYRRLNCVLILQSCLRKVKFISLSSSCKYVAKWNKQEKAFHYYIEKMYLHSSCIWN